MESYGPPQALYYLSEALLCIAFIVGIVAGVIAITRKKVVPGILAIVAFLFMGVELLFRILLWNVLIELFTNYSTANWLSFCVSSPLLILSAIALVAFVFMNTGKKTSLPPPPGFDEPPSNS